MLTLIVRAGNRVAPLVETLTPLVDGVVRGLAGKLILVVPSENSEIFAVANEAGADIIVATNWHEGLTEAARRAKGGSLLIADAGVIADSLLWPAVERSLRQGYPAAGKIVATQQDRNLRNLIGAPWRKLRGKVTPDQIVLMAREDIKGDIWGIAFGKKLVLLPARTQRFES